MAKRIVWIVVAALLGIGSYAGGDASIICGWLFLAWTVPFGVVWQFLLEGAILGHASETAQIAGTIIVIIVAYAFWFIVAPKLLAKYAPTREGERNAL